MDSPQSVVSPFKNLSVNGEKEKRNSDVYIANSDFVSKDTEVQRNEMRICEAINEALGVLDVHIHQARDIHNICIYHKQDVYSKICLTSDPENTVATQIINGGGRNPVFNESLRLNVRTVESSLKCEVWMLSRVRNYLEDQLLGFALVPLSDVLVADGKLVEKEFSLSSTDLYHSPAGFVQLSLNYSGASPDVMMIPKLPITDSAAALEESERKTSEYNKLEFPDLNIVNENQIMVSEYLDSQSTHSPVSSETDNHFSSETGVLAADSFSVDDSISVSTNGSPAIVPPKSPRYEEYTSALKEKQKSDDFTAEHVPNQDKETDVIDGKNEINNIASKEATFDPGFTLRVEPVEESVVQQDIVDMYMKSMHQFTESLAKMKLPMDQYDSNSAKSENSSSSDLNVQTPKTPGSRVFYGSRAFF